MKNFLILFLLFSKVALAQSYMPFQFGNTRWMFNIEKMYSTKSYCYFSKDTAGYYYNGKKYWRIEYIEAPTYTPTNWGFYIFDDTAQRKVFTIDTSTHQENLLYDFSANIGDTIFSVYNGPHDGLDTVIIDSIKTINSRKRIYSHRIANITWPFERCEWIEGIGSSYDLRKPSRKLSYLLEIDYRLICHQYNGNINYGTFIGCDNFQTSIISIDKNNQKINVHYNPFLNSITVSNLLNENYTMSLYDITGKLILEATSNLGSETFKLPNLSQSLYIYRISSKSFQLTNKIVMSGY